MSEYRIFLASSIRPPVCYDRMAVGNFVRKVNDAFRDCGVQTYLELFLCELGSPDVTPSLLKQKQQEYDERIVSETDLFLNLYHSEVGSVSEHELDLAMSVIEPENILVMFRQTLQPGETVRNLKTKLDQAVLPYREYEDVNAVKLALIQWLKIQEPDLPIVMESSSLKIGGTVLLG